MLCDPSNGSRKDMKVKVGWTIRQSPCFEEYIGPDISVRRLTSEEEKPAKLLSMTAMTTS